MMQSVRFIFSLLVCSLLSACVTQEFADENKPIVQNQVSDREIAFTRISLGLGYLKMGNTTQAKLNLEKAKHYAPNLIEVYTAFAHYYEYVEEPELATAAYQKALSINDKDANTLNNFGVFLCRQGKPNEAEKQWLKAVDVPSYTQVSESYENLANCQLQHQHFVKAEDYLVKAIAHSPSNASSLMMMAKLKYAKQDYSQAEQYIARYEKATRHFAPDALVTAFKLYQKEGKQGIAKNYAAMLLKMFPQSYQAKQYILNGLQDTEMDQLASQYQQMLNGKSTSTGSATSKKRIIKLSPHKQHPPLPAVPATKTTTLPASATDKQSSIVTQAPSGVIQPKNKAGAAKPVPNSVVEQPKVPTLKSQNGETMLTLPVHIVRAGDSLFSISKKYNIRFSRLLVWNHKNQTSTLHVGDVIYLSNPKRAVLK